MKVNVENLKSGHGNIQVVKVDGYLDAHTFPDLEKTLYGLMNEGQKNFLLDFEALDYISSAGLGLLLGIHRRASEKLGGVKIIHMSDSIFRVFDVLGFSRIIDVLPDRESALKSFAKAPEQASNNGVN